MEQIKKNSFQAWILAARPKTLSGAILPVMVGSSLAFSYGTFKWQPASICLLFAILMQITANFINDLYDFKKGVDREERLGPERACTQGWISPDAMQKGIILFSGMACLIGSLLLFYGGWELIITGIFCVLFAFLYTAGPYPLAYHGWGDILVFIFFGFVPVGFTYYLQAGNWNIALVICSLVCGCIVDTLLVVNNYRDIEADTKNSKKTIIVILGKKFGERLYLYLGILAALLCFYFIKDNNWYAAILPQFYLIFHIRTWKRMVKINKGKALNVILGETSRNMIIMGLLLSIGLLLGK